MSDKVDHICQASQCQNSEVLYYSQSFVCGRIRSDGTTAFNTVLATRQFVSMIVCKLLFVDAAQGYL